MKRVCTLAIATSIVIVALCATALSASLSGVFTYHFDNARDGRNLSETILTPSNVNSKSFGRLFARGVDGFVYAEPLYVNGVVIHKRAREVVYVATEHDGVYAFDATGRISKPFWRVSFIDPRKGITTMTAAESGSMDIVPEIGITGTPVIDPDASTLFVVAVTQENGVFFQRLHALDLATGKEKTAPVALAATVPGTGDGSDTNGNISFLPEIANQRCGLALNNGVVYVSFASHGDKGHYHGWVLGYDAQTLQQVTAFAATPNGFQGGIWMSGGAPMVDADGNIYLSTGNGTFDADQGGLDYGDTVLKLAQTDGMFNVLDYFTPFDQERLNDNDLDLSSGGVIALPDQSTGPQHLLFAGGKGSTLYLIDRDNMGHFHSGDDSQIVQSIAGPVGPLFSTPAYYNGMVYLATISDNLKAFSLVNGLLSTAPVSTSNISFPYPGATPSISANVSQNGIVWAIRNSGNAELYAFDANDLTVVLYHSNEKKFRDKTSGYVKFQVPTVADGRVFVGSQKRITAFGLRRN